MREMVTIQVGGYANFIGSHFWNFQVILFLCRFASIFGFFKFTNYEILIGLSAFLFCCCCFIEKANFLTNMLEGVAKN